MKTFKNRNLKELNHQTLIKEIKMIKPRLHNYNLLHKVKLNICVLKMILKNDPIKNRLIHNI